MKQLFISDLDGTLLRDDGTLSDSEVLELNSFIAKNHFSVATGRSLLSCQKILKDIDFKLPIITNNGSIISYLNGDKPIKINSLNSSMFEFYQQLIGEYSNKLFVQTYCVNKNEFKFYYQEPKTVGQQWYVKQRMSFGDNNMYLKSIELREPSEEIIQVILCEKTQGLDKLYQKIKSNININVSVFLSENPYLSEHSWLDVSSSLANKGEACQWMCDKLKLSTKNLHVFGDGANDQSMFLMAGHSFAMEKAADSLKKLSTQIIKEDCESPVLTKMKNLI